MKTCMLLLLLQTSFIGFSKSDQDSLQVNETSDIYIKNTNFEEKLSFQTDLKEKYDGRDFIYKDDLKAKEPVKTEVSTPSASPNGIGFLAVFASFMSSIFPFLLGLIIVIIIVKILLGSDADFWNYKKSAKKIAEKLIYEDDDIHETDFNKLLENAIANTDFRLATRYYYLSLLKKLSDKKSITYHKDKTNTEYVFEIEDKLIRNQFSEVSYIYSYVWYGKFPIDSFNFQTIEKKYKTLFNSIN